MSAAKTTGTAAPTEGVASSAYQQTSVYGYSAAGPGLVDRRRARAGQLPWCGRAGALGAIQDER